MSKAQETGLEGPIGVQASMSESDGSNPGVRPVDGQASAGQVGALYLPPLPVCLIGDSVVCLMGRCSVSAW